MKRNMILTDIRRDIWQTKNRFFSIMAIVALGTGFFAGIKATTPNMELTADEYYRTSKLSDYHLLSTLGLTEDDVSTLSKLDEVKAVMPGYSADLFVGNQDDMETIMKVISIPLNRLPSDETFLNQPVLKQGKMPYQSGECLLDARVSSFSIGDKIQFISSGKDTDLSDILHVKECTVVGLIQSARYISFDRGSTSIGNGILRGYIMLPEEDFSYEVYTDIYLALNNTENMSAFSTIYEKTIEDFTKKLEQIADRQEQLRYDDIYQKAMEKIQDGENELLNGETEAKKELGNAWKKLVDGRNKIFDAKNTLIDETAKAQKELTDAEKELHDGEATYKKEYADFVKKIEDAQKEIDDGWIEIEKAENKLANGKAELIDGQRLFDQEKSEALAKLDEAQAQVEQLIGIRQAIQSDSTEELRVAADLLATEQSTQQLGTLLHGYLSDSSLKQTVVTAFTSAIETFQQEITKGKQQLTDAQTKLNNASSELKAGERELNQARIDLQQGQQTLLEEQAKALSEFQDARVELDDGWKKLEDGRSTLQKETEQANIDIADGERELNVGLRDYNKAKVEAEKELADARIELDDAKKELAKLEFPKWYVFDRNDQVGYASYEEDAMRVDKIAGVFPVFFILIAALVCLSTMSRMVEEQRIQIGTWKALGYSRLAIASKYVIYALLASIIGSIIGLSIGLTLFPRIIFDAFKIMYIMPDILTPLHVDMIVISMIVSILCTTLSAALACRQELMIAPSQLMRPKPPKNGKRVLLEQIPWIWNRLSFNAKITIRNLMRYKGRVLMTMIGIGGCTALMLTGFGLQYSISSIVNKQYGSVFHYDVLGAIDETMTSSERSEIEQLIDKSSLVNDSMFVYYKSIDALHDDKNFSAYLFVPEQPDRINSFISFQRRIDQKPMVLSDTGVMITEKLAKLLNVSIGDKITLLEGKQEVSIAVSSIVENYTFHYVYMTPELYETLFEVPMESNMLIANLVGDGSAMESLFAEELLSHDAILGVSFSREAGQKFADLIGALNMIVVVLIVCAGALAFVVLYNLTNINVNERLRELATIKVLGFYDLEVSSYIYRENTISAFLGMITGLLMGIVLHQFVIANAEVEMVMFTPSIDLPSYWYAAILTMIFTLIVNIALHFRLKRIDMVESLKSVE